jgi:hypothetical protein
MVRGRQRQGCRSLRFGGGQDIAAFSGPNVHNLPIGFSYEVQRFR